MRPLSHLISELKRRNVFRAGAAYLVLAWLVVQIADILLDAFSAPSWAMRTLIVALSLGFPVALALSWVYEITVVGVKFTDDVLPNESITERTGRKLDFIVIGLLSVAVAVFAIDRFVWRQFDTDSNDLAYEHSIAVLPFGFASNEIAPFFGQLSSETARLLERSSTIRLASSDAIKSIPEDLDIPEIAAHLGVRFILSGILEMKEQNLLLKLSLFDNKGETEVWSDTVEDAQQKDTLIAVAESLATQVGAGTLQLDKRSTDPVAYNYYLQARQLDASDFMSDEAETLYRKAIELSPKFAEAYAGICGLYIHKYMWTKSPNDFESAERNCMRAWTIDEKLQDVQSQLASLYSKSGQLQKARELLKKVLSVNPNSYSAQAALAETYHEENPELAESILRRLIAQNPGSPDAYMSLQYLYYKQGRYSEAVEQQRWAVRLLPDDEGAKIRLSADLLMAGMFDEGKKLLYSMLNSGTTKTASVELNLGTILFFDGDYAEAARLYESAIDKAPYDSIKLRALGDAVWHFSGPEAAQDIFKRAILVAGENLRIDPTDYARSSSMMVSYASIGDAENFNRLRKALLESAGNDPYNHYDVAVGASRLGKMEMARDHARKAFELGFPVALLKADPDIAASGETFD